MALAPWERLAQGWQLAPPLVGVAVIAAAIQNMDGGRAVYDGFYLYVALAASYFLPGHHLRVRDRGDRGRRRGAAARRCERRVDRALDLRGRRHGDDGAGAALGAQAGPRLRGAGAQARAGRPAHGCAQPPRLRVARERRAVACAAPRAGGHARSTSTSTASSRSTTTSVTRRATSCSRRAAISMGATLRGEDVLARVGGDEFVALLGLVSTEHATSIADRLTAAIRRVARAGRGVRARQRHDRLRHLSARRRDARRADARGRRPAARAQALAPAGAAALAHAPPAGPAGSKPGPPPVRTVHRLAGRPRWRPRPPAIGDGEVACATITVRQILSRPLRN